MDSLCADTRERPLRDTTNRAMDLPYRFGNVSGDTNGRSFHRDGHYHPDCAEQLEQDAR